MSKIIVALDYTNPLEALEMCAKLRDVADGFKINHALWSQSVYIKDYTQAGELFVDCKLWDTPNTVKQVVQKIVDKGATMTTICTHNNEAVFQELKPFTKENISPSSSFLLSSTTTAPAPSPKRTAVFLSDQSSNHVICSEPMISALLYRPLSINAFPCSSA